jgi:DNA-binding transcriptional ArsR family regulator
MPAKKRDEYVIREVKAIRLLGSPLRQAMLDWISANGAATVAELSEHLRRPADRLYYHVRLLERAGLLVAESAEAASGRAEARFDVPARRMLLEYQPSAANRRAVKAVIASILRSARADFDKAIADPAVRVDGPARELWSGRIEATLTSDDIETLNTALERILALMGRSRARTSAAKAYQFTWVVSPVSRGKSSS